MTETGDADAISGLIQSFTRTNEDLMKGLIQIQYYSRGSLSRDDIYAMCHAERELVIEFLNKRFEEAHEMMKNKVPVFL